MNGPLRRFGAALAVLALVGCYTLVPAGGTDPQVGKVMAFDINDAGRSALGGSMGPEIAQVEGQIIEKDSGAYVVSVASVKLLRGGEQTWSGERVTLRQDYLGTTYEKRFSKGRSIGLGVIGVGGLTLFLATRNLLGLGSEENDTTNDTVSTRLGRP